MYKIILTNATNDNQKIVWDVKQDIKLLRSASMQKQEDGIDSVSISPVHNFVENSATFIQSYNTLIEIINEKTNVIEFKGRVLSPESEMTDSGLFTHELIFEGAEAYLKDSIQSYSFEFDKMPVENLKKVIAHHNNELKSEAYKHFKVGNVTVEKNIIPSDENYNEELKYFKRSDDKDTYETLMDLKEKYGGTFIFEPTNDVTLVHWLKETGNLTNTVIKIGKNLKSIQKKFDASEVITRLKPLGASSETTNGDEIKLTIAEVNNGSPYIDIPQLIKLFGIQTGTVTFDDKHTPETLKKAAEDWIKEHEKKQTRISLSLDALDLSYLKLDPDEFKIYNKHRVICPPLNIDEDLKIISIKVDLLKPYDKEVSFGERELGYAELEKERSIKNTNLIINKTVPSIIDRQTGGINRDVMVLNDYKITFEDLKLHQSNLLDEVNQILNSEYLVDNEVRADLLLKAQNVESLSNTIKDALESADERTINATKLVALQNKMNAYRSALKSFVIAKEGAKISLLKRLQILQSQYTEKKFSDAMETVAKTLPNGKWNADTKTLTSDVPNQDKLDSIVNDLKLFVNNQDNALETKIGKSVDAKIVDTKNEFTRQFTEVNSKVDGIEIGGRNLILDSTNFIINSNNAVSYPIETSKSSDGYNQVRRVIKDTQYNKTLSLYINKFFSADKIGDYTATIKVRPTYDIALAAHNGTTVICKAGVWTTLISKLKATAAGNVMRMIIYHNSTNDFAVNNGWIEFKDYKVEYGNKPTDWTPAPEDTDKSINDVKVRVETVEGGLTATNKKFETVYSKTETEQLLNSNLQPIKTDVNNTKSSITQLDKEIKTKVSQTTYMTDQANVVQRLNSADSERQQLSNQIADRVTLTSYNSGIKDAKDYADGVVNGLEIGGRNLVLNSNKNVASSTYLVDRYELSEDWTTEKYTITVWGTINSTSQKFGVWADNGSFHLAYLTPNATRDVWTGTFNGRISTSSQVYPKRTLSLYNFPQATAGAAKITKVKLEKGNKPTDYTPAPEDTDQKLTTMKTEIIQDGTRIAQTVSNETFNAKAKTLNRVLSQYINDISTGHQFTYDENGNITNFSVGSSGIKLNARVIDMNDGDVTIKDGVTTISDAYIPKLFSKQATIEYLKARDIDLNKATVSGSSEGETTVLSGGKIRSTGTFTRTFPEGSATYESYTESWNGTYRSGLISKTSGGKKQTGITRWLSLNDKSITTQREIHSASPDKNGARFIDFFAEETFGSDVTGQGMHIYSGQALKIESEYGLYLNANKRFYIRTEDSGLEINKDGQNLVLKRTTPYNSTAGSGGSYMSIQSSDGVEQGHVGILSNNRHLSLKSSYGEVLLKGSKVFALDADGVNRVQMYAQYFSGEKIIGNIEAAESNIYAMCHDELRVVSKAGYNNGDPNYKNIRFGSWNAMSHEKYKHDIKAWDYNVLDIYRNDLLLHSYKVNSEKDSPYYRIHHGIILRENSNLDQFPVEWRNGDGFDGNEVLWWNTKATQELAHENTDLKNRVNDLENRLLILEDKLNESTTT